MRDLNDRVAVIVGGGGGIGRAVAVNLASKGCHIALADINETALAESVAAIGDTSIKVTTHPLDVTSAEGVAAFKDEVVEQHGKVNILINCAGITLQKRFETHRLEDWEWAINLNLWGTLHTCREFLPELKKTNGDAHLMNISSMTGFVGLPNQTSYCATKGAIKGLTEALWGELKADGIGVTVVHPGAIKTDMIKATLEHSDDVEWAKRNFEMVQKIGTDVDYAAAKMVKAIIKNKARIRIGKDAVIFDLLTRLMPTSVTRLITWAEAKENAKRAKGA